MDILIYDDETQGLLSKLEENTDKTNELTPKLCTKLRLIAGKTNDELLRGMSDYYLGYYYYRKFKGNDAIRYIDSCILKILHTPDKDTLARALRLMGNIYLRQGNPEGANRSYMAGIRIAMDGMCTERLLALYVDMAELCIDLGSYKQGLKYCLAAEKILSDSKEKSEIVVLLYIKNMVNFEKVYVALGNSLNAADIYTKIMQYAASMYLVNLEPYVSVANLIYDSLRSKGDAKQAKPSIEGLAKAFLLRKPTVDHLFEYVLLLDNMEKSGLYENEFTAMVEKVELLLKGSDLCGVLKKISALKIDFFKNNSIKDKLLEEYESYRTYCDASEKCIAMSMENVISIENNDYIDKDTKVYVNRSVTVDEMTGLPNRMLYNELADKFFDKCLVNEVNFGVFVITIDNLKELGASYDVNRIDECIRAASEVMKTYIAPDRFVIAYYGGVDFIMITQNIGNQQVAMILQEIMAKISELCKERRYPVFTMSSGGCNHIPRRMNKIWDYTSTADMALVQANKLGIGQLLVVSHSSEIEKTKSFTICPKPEPVEEP
jgi:diguanylate cyclase (GGDEF)-like protein